MRKYSFLFHFGITGVAWIFFLYWVLLHVHPHVEQGNAQRIFYFHVPTAWVSFSGFLISFIYSILYLIKRNTDHDRMATVFAVTGWVFTTGVLITGPLWAKPIWGVFWNWSDERLISFFVLWLAYFSYMILRISISDSSKRARLSAGLSIIAFLNVPLVYFAIRIWNTPAHPGAVIAGGEGSGLGNMDMKVGFWTGVLCFHLLFFLITRVYSLMLKFKPHRSF